MRKTKNTISDSSIQDEIKQITLFFFFSKKPEEINLTIHLLHKMKEERERHSDSLSNTSFCTNPIFFEPIRNSSFNFTGHILIQEHLKNECTTLFIISSILLFKKRSNLFKKSPPFSAISHPILSKSLICNIVIFDEHIFCFSLFFDFNDEITIIQLSFTTKTIRTCIVVSYLNSSVGNTNRKKSFGLNKISTDIYED